MSLPQTQPPLLREDQLRRHLPLTRPFVWLAAGVRDLTTTPLPSVLYGTFVFIVSVGIISGLVWAGHDYVLLPALSAFVVAGPVLAIGLYEKSRRLRTGERVNLSAMVFVVAKSGGQVLYIGALLTLLAMVWVRASIIIYALFFGLQPFPGIEQVVTTLLFTSTGLTMLLVGTLIGGLFAAFSFAISFLAVPMLLDKEVDAFTAMGRSMAAVWANIGVTIVWGAIVVALSIFAMATALLGIIIVFPLLGHATWHAYEDFKEVL